MMLAEDRAASSRHAAEKGGASAGSTGAERPPASSAPPTFKAGPATVGEVYDGLPPALPSEARQILWTDARVRREGKGVVRNPFTPNSLPDSSMFHSDWAWLGQLVEEAERSVGWRQWAFGECRLARVGLSWPSQPLTSSRLCQSSSYLILTKKEADACELPPPPMAEGPAPRIPRCGPVGEREDATDNTASWRA